jgi:hypothetical protein
VSSSKYKIRTGKGASGRHRAEGSVEKAAAGMPLEAYEIGISGAIPERADWTEPAMDRGILEFVALFSGIVFRYGGRIVHGSHPTFTPVILRQARQHAGPRSRAPVTLIRSALWEEELTEDAFRSITDVAELIVTRKIGNGGAENAGTRNASLTAMRRVLIDAQNIMVSVGGKYHNSDGLIAGVGEEMTMAGTKNIPRFLVGGLGGYSHSLASKVLPKDLSNFLTDAQNAMLFTTTDVGACVGMLFQHLSQSSELITATQQPVKWNPWLQKVIDHRDGAVDIGATRNIQYANVTHPIAAPSI